MNRNLIAAALFNSLKSEEWIQLIPTIAPGVNEQYKNLRKFSLVCKKFFNAAALDKANVFYDARDEFSLFQEEKINYIGNSSFELPDDVLCYMSQFFFFASNNQKQQISMTERLWRWHNEAGAKFTADDDFNAPKFQ